jgi:hypothetical protein
MKDGHFQDLSPQEQEWLDAYLNGTIDRAVFEALQDRMLENPALPDPCRAT